MLFIIEIQDNKVIGKKILKFKSCEQFSNNLGSFDHLSKAISSY